MKKKLPYIIGFVLITLFALWYGYRDVTHQTYDNNVNTAQYSDMGVLREGEYLEQTITVLEDSIDAFLIKTNVLGDHAPAMLHLSVTDKGSGEVVAESEVSGAEVKARKLQRFSINTLTGCRGKEYTLRLTEASSDENNGVSFYYQPERTESSAGLFVMNGEEKEGVMVMKTVTHRFDAESFIVMLISVLFIWGFLWYLSRLFK